MNKLYNVGLYIRLSRENTEYSGHDSTSIENQESMLSKFAAMMPGWVEKRTYIDNGASGGNFNRQGFRDMMDDIRKGVINLVLVQDLSRFGRNYLETGRYLEEELPALGCRFVALADGVDTEDGENDIMPFLNAFNDFYLKNLSDRIKSVFQAKAKAGHKLTGSAPYGYMRDPDNHTNLIIDEYAADVVKRIFAMRAEGMGYGKIVGALNREKIPSPRLYYYLKQNLPPTEKCGKSWLISAIPRILKNELYLGNTVSLKYTRSYRSAKLQYRKKDEWLTIPNTHATIVDIETWNKVQAVNERLTKWTENARKPQTYLFSGKIFCSDCGIALMPHSEQRYRNSDNDERRNTYSCKTYHSSGRQRCSRHSINEEVLVNVVLENVKKHAAAIAHNEKHTAAELRKKLLGVNSDKKADAQRQLRDLKQMLHNLDIKLEQLYENKVIGVISLETFKKLASKTEADRAGISEQIKLLEQGANETEKRLNDIENWIRLIKENAAVSHVDRILLDALIERVEIGENKVENGEKMQDIRVIYRFIGDVLKTCP